MQGMAAISSLLTATRPTHRPLGVDRNDVMATVRRIQGHELAAAAGASDPSLARDLTDATAQGRDILQIGCAPTSIMRRDRTWTVEIHVLMEGERCQRIISITLSGDMALVSAVQTSVRPLSAAA